MIYINKDAKPIYVKLDALLDPESNYIGSTWEDYKAGAWILLTDEQIAFKESNPDATVEEVYNMQLAHSPVDPDPVPEPDPLQEARRAKLAEIEAQDKFSEKFFVSVTTGGKEVANVELWANSALRTSLLGSTLPAEASDGKTTTTLWSTTTPSQPLEVPIEWAKKNLLVLEIYAKRTYDLMQINNNATLAATTIEEIAQIDPKANYPYILTFELNLDNYEQA